MCILGVETGKKEKLSKVKVSLAGKCELLLRVMHDVI